MSRNCEQSRHPQYLQGLANAERSLHTKTLDGIDTNLLYSPTHRTADCKFGKCVKSLLSAPSSLLHVCFGSERPPALLLRLDSHQTELDSRVCGSEQSPRCRPSLHNFFPPPFTHSVQPEITYNLVGGILTISGSTSGCRITKRPT